MHLPAILTEEPEICSCYYFCVGTVAAKRQIWCMWGDERRCGADSRPESDSPTPEGASPTSHHHISVCVCMCVCARFTLCVLLTVFDSACTRLCVKYVCVCVCVYGLRAAAWREWRGGESGRNAAMSLRSLDSRCLHNNTQRGHVQAGKSRTPRHACQSFKVTVSSRSLKHAHRLCAEKAADAAKWICKSVLWNIAVDRFKTLSMYFVEVEAALLGRGPFF